MWKTCQQSAWHLWWPLWLMRRMTSEKESDYMTANKSNPISGITLEGFQVFDKPTYIPLDRLTLMFGPNSAGKSAVQDAIEIYSKVVQNNLGGFAITVPSVAELQSFMRDDELLKRHWRRDSENSDSRVAQMSISVAHSTSCSIWVPLAEVLNRVVPPDPLDWPIKLESKLYFKNYNTDRLCAFTWDSEFFIASELFVRYVDRRLHVNLAHPVLKNFEIRVDFEEVARIHPKETSFENGFFLIKEGIDGFHPSGFGVNEKGAQWLRAYWPSNPLLTAALAEISLLVGHVLSLSHDSSNFHPVKVEASRTIPSGKELIFEFFEFDDRMHNPLLQSDERYESVTESLISELIDLDSA